MRRALPHEQRLQIGAMSVDSVVFQRFLLFCIPHQSPPLGRVASTRPSFGILRPKGEGSIAAQGRNLAHIEGRGAEDFATDREVAKLASGRVLREEKAFASAIQKIVLGSARDIPFKKLVLSQSNLRGIQCGISVEELAELSVELSVLPSSRRVRGLRLAQ